MSLENKLQAIVDEANMEAGIAVTHVEAFLAEDVQDVLAELSQFAADIDPDSFEVTPDAIEDMGIFGAKIIIRTAEAV